MTLRQIGWTAALALCLALAWETCLPLLRPLYGSVGTCQHADWTYYGLCAALLLSRSPWSLHHGVAAASAVLAAHQLLFRPAFLASDRLGLPLAPLFSWLSAPGLALLLAGLPVVKSCGRLWVAVIFPAAHVVVQSVQSTQLTSFLSSDPSMRLFIISTVLASLVLVVPHSSPLLKQPTSAKSSKKLSSRYKHSSSRAQQPPTARQWQLAILPLLCAMALHYLHARFLTHQISVPLPWHADADDRSLQLLFKAQSNTGKIAVIEYEFAPDMWMRALKADHSLLGGVWIGQARAEVLKQRQKRVRDADEQDERDAVDLAQSIFSTFILQEAIRLVERPAGFGGKASALIIGLGAGVSAKALQQHGVDVSITEIDPAVWQAAHRFFGVAEPAPGQLYLEDARVTLRRSAAKYDYVIHDVFTGGSVPPSLFTLECWQDVKHSLKSGGVLAVNFAGNLESKASASILQTLQRSFVSCRAFDDGTEGTHKNLVIFCADWQDLTFRAPQEADYLDSPLRLQTLSKFQRQEFLLPKQAAVDQGIILSDTNSSVLEQWQQAAALEHWQTLRDQIPADFWMA